MNQPEPLIRAERTTLFITVKNIPDPQGLVVDLSVALEPLLDTPDEMGLQKLLSNFSKSLSQAILDGSLGDPELAAPHTERVIYDCSVLIRGMVYPLQLAEQAT